MTVWGKRIVAVGAGLCLAGAAMAAPPPTPMPQESLFHKKPQKARPQAPQTQSIPVQDNASDTPATQWSDVTTVVVRAKAPGPAMWKLTKGNSTVWVLGILAETPENFTWDTRRVEKIIQGAKTIIVPGHFHGSRDASDRWARGSELPSGDYLRNHVSPETYDRFEAAVSATPGLASHHYIIYTPVRAGKTLFEDSLDARHILRYDMTNQIVDLSEARRGPKAESAYVVDSDVLTDGWLKMGADDQEACLNDFLDGITYDTDVLPGMAAAWATGDLPTVLSQYQESSQLTCNLRLPKWQKLYQDQFIGKMSEAITKAMKKGGRSLAVVPFVDLLRKDGVLDQLRAQGVTITSPEM